MKSFNRNLEIMELGGFSNDGYIPQPIEPPAFRMPSERSSTNPQPLMNKYLLNSVIFRHIKDR